MTARDPGPSMHWTHLARWISLLACGIWTLTLLASSLAKFWNPWPAAAMNLRVGLGGHVAFVLLIACFEIATVWLLLRRGLRDPIGVLAAGGFAMVILIWRVTFGEEMAEGCGCFGGLQVPEWLAWVTASCGFLGCSAILLARLYRPGLHMRIMIEAAALAVLLFGTSALLHLQKGEHLDEQGLAKVALSQHSILMIGSVDCPHCRETLALVHRVHPTAIPSGRLCLVTKGDDPGLQGLPANLQNLSILQISDILWWKLVKEGPPQFYLPHRQALIHLDGQSTLLQELRQAPARGGQR